MYIFRKAFLKSAFLVCFLFFMSEWGFSKEKGHVALQFQVVTLTRTASSVFSGKLSSKYFLTGGLDFGILLNKKRTLRFVFGAEGALRSYQSILGATLSPTSTRLLRSWLGIRFEGKRANIEVHTGAGMQDVLYLQSVGNVRIQTALAPFLGFEGRTAVLTGKTHHLGAALGVDYYQFDLKNQGPLTFNGAVDIRLQVFLDIAPTKWPVKFYYLTRYLLVNSSG